MPIAPRLSSVGGTIVALLSAFARDLEHGASELVVRSSDRVNFGSLWGFS